MPDVGSLYPQPPQQQPQGNSLLSNPGQAIGLMQGLQNLQIQRQQMPALVQQPAANLNQTNTSIQGAVQQQQATFADDATRFISNYLAGVKNPSDEMVREATAQAANRFGPQSKLFPDVIPGIHQTLMNSRDRPGTIARFQASVMPAGEAASQAPTGYDPVTGITRQGTKAQQIQGAAHGGYETTPPLGTDVNIAAKLADQTRTANYPREVNGMIKARQLLQELGPGGTGEGTEGRQRFMNFFTSMFPNLASDAQRNKVSEYDQLHKYLINNAQDAAQSFGPHTNEGLSTAVAGRPNAKISDLANDQLLQMNIAYRRMEQAHIDQSAKQGGLNYIGKKSEIAPQLDANAFRIDLMSPAERKNLAKKMSPSEKDRFNRSVGMAVDSGVVLPPGQ